jgi:hypothetical protein
MPLPPRVLLVMPDQWPRALLRAALREAGYDALGAPGLPAALHYPRAVADRGPVRVVLIDQAAMSDDSAARLLGDLLQRHGDPEAVLLARALPAAPLPAAASAVAWRRVIRRPASVGDLVAAVRDIFPLPPEASRPLD